MFLLGVHSWCIVASPLHCNRLSALFHGMILRIILPFDFAGFTWPVFSEYNWEEFKDLGYYQQPFRDLLFGSTPGFFGRGMAL
jgi:hypothetical protein